MSAAAPQAGMGSHYSQVPGSLPEQGDHRCWQEGFSQASHLWPALEFVSSKTVHMCSKSVCMHVGLGVVGCACGFMSNHARHKLKQLGHT